MTTASLAVLAAYFFVTMIISLTKIMSDEKHGMVFHPSEYLLFSYCCNYPAKVDALVAAHLLCK